MSYTSEDELVVDLNLNDNNNNNVIESAFDDGYEDFKSHIALHYVTMKKEIVAQFQNQLKNQQAEYESKLLARKQEIEILQNVNNQLIRTTNKQEIIIENLSLKSSSKITLYLFALAFGKWREFVKEEKQLRYLEEKAINQRRRHLLTKTIQRWRNNTMIMNQKKLNTKWQKTSEEIAIRLHSEYDIQIQSLKSQLEQAKKDVQDAQEASEKLKIDMKNAFMRGVCALNLEAMSMMNAKQSEAANIIINPNQDDFENSSDTSDNIQHPRSKIPAQSYLYSQQQQQQQQQQQTKQQQTKQQPNVTRVSVTKYNSSRNNINSTSTSSMMQQKIN